ncbi:TPA: hypothetical protein HA251_06970 [Candidatus Woesearchaeota archaeon]|nr:hypothetical protein [Candidatus Woesearchaeota archaeon]
MLQPLVEQKLDVSLGVIDVKPFPCCIDEILDKMRLRSSTSPLHYFWMKYAIGLPVAYLVEFTAATAKAGAATVYYSRHPAWSLQPEPFKRETVLHELAHIGHRRIVGGDTGRYPEYVVEGFADLVAIAIESDAGRHYVRPSYDYAHYRRFMQDLASKEITAFPQMLNYLRSIPKHKNRPR